ncbi:hypothetical protein K6119_11420 [Paracrocinitomix mangrovi]|uniref:hypothetical protein n=1 Tax=Paracrocinitomix mangrovi TaxID=2862509 RepID=UPI001C8E389F|nr:hypothetical protein [Paracrocinitomix mangrovi]UKN00344.1 hypothetical protein K6119_11420 [Paracrocinitomix mangrovi]
MIVSISIAVSINFVLVLLLRFAKAIYLVKRSQKNTNIFKKSVPVLGIFLTWFEIYVWGFFAVYIVNIVEFNGGSYAYIYSALLLLLPFVIYSLTDKKNRVDQKDFKLDVGIRTVALIIFINLMWFIPTIRAPFDWMPLYF